MINRKMRVLIVEDEIELVGVMKKAVEYVCSENQCVCTVDFELKAKDVVNRHKSVKYDLIIVDLALPDGDGMDIIKLIREFDKVVEFIIVTGNPSLDTAVAAISHDVWAYFAKPFQLDDLVAQSRKAIENSILKSKILSLSRLAGKVLNGTK